MSQESPQDILSQFKPLGQANKRADRGEKSELRVTDLPMVDYAEVHPSPVQPRRHFDEEAHEQLVQNIKWVGRIIVPLELRKRREGGYIIVHGERRWRAIRHLVEEEGREEFRDIPFILASAKGERGRRDTRAYDIMYEQYMEEAGRQNKTALENAVHLAHLKQLLEGREGREISARELAEHVPGSKKSVERLLRVGLTLTEPEVDCFFEHWPDAPQQILLNFVKWVDRQEAAVGRPLTPKERLPAIEHLTAKKPTANNLAQTLKPHALKKKGTGRSTARTRRSFTVSAQNGVNARFWIPATRMNKKQATKMHESLLEFAEQVLEVIPELPD